MKTPAWLSEVLADYGQQVLDDDIAIADAAREIAGLIDVKDPVLKTAILADFSRQRLRQWIYQRVRGIIAEEKIRGQQPPLPFPELQPQLEVGIGRTVHQNVMTGRDWDNARAIYLNRRDQAQVSFQIFERAYRKVRPLLIDDTLTTADVIDDLDDGEAEAQ